MFKVNNPPLLLSFWVRFLRRFVLPYATEHSLPANFQTYVRGPSRIALEWRQGFNLLCDVIGSWSGKVPFVEWGHIVRRRGRNERGDFLPIPKEDAQTAKQRKP
jgi:hypothetical protein